MQLLATTALFYGHELVIMSPMSLRSIICLGFVLLGFGPSRASAQDVIVLRQQSSITGKVLAEKPEMVAVDVGYTVLTIPKTQIVKIERGLGL